MTAKEMREAEHLANIVYEKFKGDMKLVYEKMDSVEYNLGERIDSVERNLGGRIDVLASRVGTLEVAVTEHSKMLRKIDKKIDEHETLLMKHELALQSA